MMPNKKSILLTLCSLLLSSISVFGDDRSGDARSTVVQLGNGVVVDITNQRIFTMQPKAGIQALDVITGNSLWKSATADKPVSVSGKALLAQIEAKKQGVLELTYLDAATGRQLSELNINIPNDVQARVTNSMDRKFSLHVANGGSPENLYWKDSFQKVRGAQLSRDEAPAKKADGFLKADFSGRTVKAVKQPQGFKGSTNHRAPMPANAIGKRALYSQNQQHIVTSSALSAEERTASASGARYQWHVYTSDGKKVGTFASPVSFAPFVVVGNKLLYVTPSRKHRKDNQFEVDPMSLLAIDLTTGNQSFKAAIRDVRFQGPFPP